MNPAVAYRQIALGDLLLFTVLAVPGLGSWMIGLLVQLNASMQWPGALQIAPGSALLVHLIGVLGAGLAWLRLSLGLMPQTLRVSVAVKFTAAALFGLGVGMGAPSIFLVLGAVDLIQALILLVFYRFQSSHLKDVEKT